MAWTAPTARALVYEVDGPTSERARQLLRADGFATCVVDDVDVFLELRTRLSFDAFVVGVGPPDVLDGLSIPRDLEPLVLLAPLAGRSDVAPYRMAFPDAFLVDRALRDVDSLRAVLVPRPAQPSPRTSDPVRGAFGPFGLSERQLEVLRFALTGDKSGDIARKLFISELTVRNHLHSIYERVGVSGRRELLGRFVQGLMEGNA